jgi:hypothetical protein
VAILGITPSSRREDLDVTDPTHVFITLRAIGGDIQKIIAHAPNDILVQFCNQQIKALEPTAALEIAVNDDGLQIL